MNRLKQYNEMTLPLLEYYDSKGVLHNFKGSTSDEITPHVQSTLARFQ